MIKNLYNALKTRLGMTEYRTVKFHMKSGKTLVARKVNIDKFRYKYNSSGGIVEISGYIQHWSVSNRVLLQSVELSQIEAITTS